MHKTEPVELTTLTMVTAGLSEFYYFTDDGGADDAWRYRLL